MKLWTDTAVLPIPTQQSEYAGTGIPVGVEFVDIEVDVGLWDVIATKEPEYIGAVFFKSAAAASSASDQPRQR